MEAPRMKVNMMLAQSAQAVNGLLYVLGGGANLMGPNPSPFAIALLIDVPWTQTNIQHQLKLELLDADFRPVMVPTPAGEAPVVINNTFEVGRPPGSLPGIPTPVPFVVNFAPLPLEPGKRFVWKLTIDDKTYDEWQVAFSTRPASAKPA